MRKTGTYLFAITVGALIICASSAMADAERGRLLYENHCTICHTSTVHIRDHHKARVPAELRAWILRWSGELKLNWGEDELADVYRHLNNRYYRFPDEKPAR